MTYFKILSIALGAWMLAGGVAAAIFSGVWKRFMRKVYPETRTWWIDLIGFLVLGMFLWTWREFWKHLNAYTFVVTFIVSLAMAKVAVVVLFYKKIREMVFALSEEVLAFRVVMLSTAAIGIALLTLGLSF